MNASTALETVAYFEAVFGRQVADEAKPIWIAKLEPFEPAEVVATIDAIASGGGYPPNIMELVAAVRRGVRKSAYEAWLDVEAEVRRVGFYGQPEELTGTTARAVEVIGWTAICDASVEDTRMLETFRRVYDSLTESSDRRALAGPSRLELGQ